MILMQGKGVSRGVVSGILHFYHRKESRVAKKIVSDLQAEHSRWQQAQEMCLQWLQQAEKESRDRFGEETSALFRSHALILQDPEFRDSVCRWMEQECCNAEYAVWQTGETFAALFAAVADPYMQERAVDVRDVTRRLLAYLQVSTEAEEKWDSPVILAAEDLSPSETIQLDKSKILGFITRQGSANSHTAILARTMGIPAVCGLGEDLKEEYQGKQVYLDGESGQVIFEPDSAFLEHFQEKTQKQQEKKAWLQTVKGLPDVTLDGKQIDIYCNIGSPEDVKAVIENDGRGIGLFRSEFLYLATEDYPTEETQFQVYKKLAEDMKGKRVVIRTLDIGVDKQVDYFRMKKEENPALGLRGIRISLNRMDVFETQLRAVYRASAFGRVAVLFPMITSLWEVRECRRICQKVMDDLQAAGIPYDKQLEIGVMIETPASVLIAEELAAEVDFFSVGTNDLTQYMLACDRQASEMDLFFDPYHPAVMRALEIVTAAAHKAGIHVGVCGELGADPEMLPTFLALGIDVLSVSPEMVLPLRAQIRSMTAQV